MRQIRTSEDAWHLERVDWLKALGEADLQELRRASKRRMHAAGETIFSPTPDPSSVYLLERGLARIYRLSAEGDQTTFGCVSAGEVFGELAALGNYPRESFAETVKPSLIWKVPRGPFQEALSGRPELVLAIARQVGDRFKRIESRVENLVFRCVRSRVASILLELAQDFGVRGEGEIELDLELTQAELATLVGTTRQSVNESLQELSDEGLIERRKRRIVLRHPEALANVAVATPQ